MYSVMDIVVCIKYRSSMASYFNRICTMILAIYSMTLANQGDVRIGLIKYRSRDDSWTIKKHDFTRNRTILKQWLHSDEPGGICPDGYEAVGKRKKIELLNTRLYNSFNIYYSLLPLYIGYHHQYCNQLLSAFWCACV